MICFSLRNHGGQRRGASGERTAIWVAQSDKVFGRIYDYRFSIMDFRFGFLASLLARSLPDGNFSVLVFSVYPKSCRSPISRIDVSPKHLSGVRFPPPEIWMDVVATSDPTGCLSMGEKLPLPYKPD